MIVRGTVRREPTLDFMTAGEAGLRGMHDFDVLTLAAQQHRILVSHDVGTMPMWFRAFRESGGWSTGVFLIAQRMEVRHAIEELVLIWTASDAQEWEGRLVWLPV
jgi:hypothetical protein